MPSKQAVDCLPAPMALAPQELREKRFRPTHLRSAIASAVTMGLSTHVSRRGRPSVSCRC